MRKTQTQICSWNGQPPMLILIKAGLAIGLCYVVAFASEPLTKVGLNTAFQAGIATILCLKEDAPNSFTEAINRSLGTLLSAVWSYAYIKLFLGVFGLVHGSAIFYLTDLIFLILMIAFLLYIRRPGAIICAVVVFLLSTMLPVSVASPFNYVLHRSIDTEIGIVIALFVNWLPPLNRFFHYHFDRKGDSCEVRDDSR